MWLEPPWGKSGEPEGRSHDRLPVTGADLYAHPTSEMLMVAVMAAGTPSGRRYRDCENWSSASLRLFSTCALAVTGESHVMEMQSPFKRLINGEDHRNADGRFRAGHPGGPGRPRRAVETEYLKVLLAGCSLEKWAEIVERATRDAVAGDAKAREWISGYVIGSPAFQAPRPFDLAVDDEAEVDAVANAAILRRVQGPF